MAAQPEGSPSSVSPPDERPDGDSGSDSESEGDSDSGSNSFYDSDYISDRDDACLDDERRIRQLRDFDRQAIRSQGFDINFEEFDYKFGIHPVKFRKRIFDYEVGTDGDLMTMCAQRSLEQYNQEKGTKLEFERVEKANWQHCRGVKFWITFLVRDPSSPDEDLKVFQAKVIYFLAMIEVRFCRPKPSEEELPEITDDMVIDF